MINPSQAAKDAALKYCSDSAGIFSDECTTCVAFSGGYECGQAETLERVLQNLRSYEGLGSSPFAPYWADWIEARFKETGKD